MNDEALQLQSFGATSVLPTLPVVIKNEKKCDRKSLGKESLEKVKMLSSCVCRTIFVVSTTSINLSLLRSAQLHYCLAVNWSLMEWLFSLLHIALWFKSVVYLRATVWYFVDVLIRRRHSTHSAVFRAITASVTVFHLALNAQLCPTLHCSTLHCNTCVQCFFDHCQSYVICRRPVHSVTY